MRLGFKMLDVSGSLTVQESTLPQSQLLMARYSRSSCASSAAAAALGPNQTNRNQQTQENSAEVNTFLRLACFLPFCLEFKD